jgi:hypothetical protein
VLRLPDYERFTQVYPSQIRELMKYDSLIDEHEREIGIDPLLAWLLLVANIVLMAMVPCWLVYDFKYEGLTRNSWRFLIIAALTLPFVAYEHRQLRAVGGSLLSLLDTGMLKKNYMSSISVCIWFLIIKYACKLTSAVHATNLMCLETFVGVTFKRIRGAKYHEFESAGFILVLSGLLCTFCDSATGPVVEGKDNEAYLSYSNL